MIQYRFIVSFLLFFALACKDAAKESPVAENNINAATDFIRAALDGKFQIAKKYMLADSVNLNYLEIADSMW